MLAIDCSRTGRTRLYGALAGSHGLLWGGSVVAYYLWTIKHKKRPFTGFPTTVKQTGFGNGAKKRRDTSCPVPLLCYTVVKLSTNVAPVKASVVPSAKSNEVSVIATITLLFIYPVQLFVKVAPAIVLRSSRLVILVFFEE